MPFSLSWKTFFISNFHALSIYKFTCLLKYCERHTLPHVLISIYVAHFQNRNITSKLIPGHLFEYCGFVNTGNSDVIPYISIVEKQLFIHNLYFVYI